MDTVLLILLAFGGFTGIGVAGVLALTLVGRLRSTPRDAALPRKLATLEERLGAIEASLADLSDAHGHVRELAERVEFLERLLQQEPRRDPLPPAE